MCTSQYLLHWCYPSIHMGERKKYEDLFKMPRKLNLVAEVKAEAAKMARANNTNTHTAQQQVLLIFLFSQIKGAQRQDIRKDVNPNNAWVWNVPSTVGNPKLEEDLRALGWQVSKAKKRYNRQCVVPSP